MLSSAARWKRRPDPGRSRLDAEADRGEVPVALLPEQGDGAADPGGALDAQGGGGAEVHGDVVLEGERLLQHLLLHLAVERDVEVLAGLVDAQPDQRVLLGDLGERVVQRTLLRGVARHDRRLQGGRREVGRRRRALGAEPVPDPHVAQARQPGDLPVDHHLAGGRPARLEDLDPRDRGVAVRTEMDPVPDPDGTRAQPHVGHPVPTGPALDLEHESRGRPVVVAPRGGQQGPHRGHQLGDPGAGPGGAEQHGVETAAGHLARQEGRQVHARGRGREAVVHEVGQHCVVTLRQGLQDRVPVGEGHDRVGQPVPDHRQHPVRVGTAAVDLVDEEQSRYPQPLQRPQQDHGLGLHAFDGGHHEHGAVEHRERAVDLGDEVRVAGGVDEVDREVTEREGDDGGTDGDAAASLQLERVGLGGAVVDAPERVGHPGGEEQPLGERGLTGVDVRQDS